MLYILVLGMLTALGPFTVDLYLPAFPLISQQFQVPQSVIQLTLTGTTLGFALGQLVMGPWSDRVGRRLPLLLATAVHITASAGAALADSVAMLSAFRVLQGVGAAAGAVVAMAMVRDLFGGKPLVKMLSRLALVNGLAPILAPVVGAQLLLVTDWRGIFYVLAFYAAFVLVAVFIGVRETLPRELRGRGSQTVWGRYRSVLGDRVYVGMALIGGLSFSGLFAYISASPFLFQEVYGLDAQGYGVLFAINSIGILIGVQTSAYLMRRVGPQWILAGVTILQILAGITMMMAVWFGGGLLGVVIPLFFYIAACGFGFPAVQVLALVRHGKQAGTAASLLGATNFGLAGIISPVVGVLGIATAVPMASVMTATAALATIVLWFVVQPRTVPALED
ncbi:multidrug effflux MFS transporter [Lysinibacter sp. HNR]|uniref:multidrug effflux MFS transporter n=1 Tax=Lysinibacter sp. HNR TaxID=3031408 RepID=UPI0024355FA8|nr:multidrug effflux MFS transporter [Lysinibacter sp. HNR]WGD38681.1 multidrug effflux MFS transporter [Lysinibacter sp. HNR]